MIVYHVTHARNVPTIRSSGLLRRFATARRKAVWCCGREMVSWAIEHVCTRHKWDRSEVVVIPFTTTLDEAKRTKWPSVYAIDGNVSADRLMPTLIVRFLPFVTA